LAPVSGRTEQDVLDERTWNLDCHRHTFAAG
jgi:hypothetical protein